MDVGFLGLGRMGRPMALNLVRAGHRVRVWNRSPQAAEELRTHGAVPVATPAEAFRGDAAVTMLADDAALRAVIVEGGLLDQAGKPGVHIGTSTISVALAEELAAVHGRAGVPYVSAPVFGRPDVAELGKLNILAAGPEDAIARAQPLLDAMGAKTWRFGETPARANAVKLAGNMMIVAAIEAMGEAAALTEAHGVAAADLLDLLTSTIFAAPVYKNYGASIAAGRYEPPGFGLALGAKDVRLALAAAETARVPMPLASVLRDSLLDALAHGDGEKDLAALATVSARRAGQR
ncbi:NAD(P)-dependent oxidoreductase [Methylobacterium frigidaeris]|uniref:3-sulfolactaldehyde reductase n=1 Tax=Methylobacterium frigidaeris TaxID=2038277 RepID=A0AA37HBW9_9HYPH|nr:NAD(P)-dependent oxidoreductase [Methylobacterium frigidaeris]PIK71194.1 oxidoreductase [Methylobacterium frigidaeris]GJD62676.1 3-sulfolactaldehyde reductase [Methylobacterium frigidaeris]